MGWLIALAVIALIAIIPVGIQAIYDQNGPLCRLLVGPVRIPLYPAKPKAEKKAKSKTEEKKKPASSEKKISSKKQKGGSFVDFLPIVKTVLEFLSCFRRKLRVKHLQIKLTMASPDPCDLAVNYGKAWAALGNLMPHLERIFVIKKRDLQINCDFTADKTLIYARIDLTITVGRVLVMAVRYGWRVLRQYQNIMKLRKGGAKV